MNGERIDKTGQKIADRHLDISDLDTAGSLGPVAAMSVSSKNKLSYTFGSFSLAKINPPTILLKHDQKCRRG